MVEITDIVLRLLCAILGSALYKGLVGGKKFLSPSRIDMMPEW